MVGERLSAACYLPNAFKASLYLAWKYAHDFEAGVVANTNAGGENCHRGAVIGGLLGSVAGVEHLPQRLVEGIDGRARSECADRRIGRRGSRLIICAARQ